MAFTALLESVQPAGDPLLFDLGLLYLDDTRPDWSVHKTLRVTIDTTLTAVQQRAALVALVKADADPYRKQGLVQAALVSLIGSTVAVP